MAVGSSGRVVIELSPELKQELHELLRRRGTNLKTWFIDQATDFIEENSEQMELGLNEPPGENRRR